MPDAVRITIELDSEVSFHDERLTDPVRVFIDFSGTRAAQNLVDRTLRFDGDADLVRQVRVGRHPNSTTRVVLDAVGVSSYSVYPLYSPFRIVIDCARPKMMATASDVRADARVRARTSSPDAKPLEAEPKSAAYVMIPLPGRRLTAAWLRSLPSVSPQHRLLLAEARAFVEPVSPAAPAIADLAPVKPVAPPTPLTTAL